MIKLFITRNIKGDFYEKVIKKSEEKIDFKFDHEQMNFLTVARLVEQKGIDRLIRIHRELIANHYANKFYIIGDGPERQKLENIIKEEHLQKTFFLLGAKENPYPYMKKADIIVQPSRREGKSLVLDEAKILGKAIVVTNYPSVTDQITDRKTGIIVDTTPQAIAEGLELLVTDKRLKSDLEDNCRLEPNRSELVVEQFYELAGI